MSRSAELLNDLIEDARNGQRFYLEAAPKVSSEVVRGIFADLANARQKLIDELATFVGGRGDAPSREQPARAPTRKADAHLRAGVEPDSETVYIRKLEKAEDRLLRHYKEALLAAPNEDTRRILQRHLLTVERTHERMRALREQTSM